MQDDIIYSPEFVETPSFDIVPKWIAKVHTDAGIVGIGESTRGADGAKLRKTADAIIGKNVFDFNLTDIDLPDRHGYEVFESALYDIVGKAVGWPVYRLLGGLAQRKVLVGYWCGRKNAEDMKRVAQRAKDGNFTSIKIKCTLEDPVVDVIQTIADEAPGIKAIVDPNQRFYTYEQCLPGREATRRDRQHERPRRPLPEEGSRGLPQAQGRSELHGLPPPEQPARDDQGLLGGRRRHVQHLSREHAALRGELLHRQCHGLRGLARFIA